MLTTEEQRLAAEAALRLLQREREVAESAQKGAEARVRELEAKLAAARPNRKR